MGGEIIYFFFIVPILLIGYNLFQLRSQKSKRKAIFLIGLGIVFLLGFGVQSAIEFSFVQGLAYGSFFYGPFYLICWLILTLAFKGGETNDA